MRALLVAGTVAAFLACGSGASLPSIRVPSPATIVGTGANDLWWLEDQALVHGGDGGEQRVLLDGELSELSTFAPAEPGTLWVVSAPAPGRLVMRKLDSLGNVLVDRSADFDGLTPGFTSGSFVARASHDGAMVLSISLDPSQRHFRFDGTKFVQLTPPAALGPIFPLAVRGLDDIWFTASNALVHHRGGVWTEFPGLRPSRFLSFDADGVGWALDASSNYELVASGGPGSPRRIEVPVLRIENDDAQRLGLEATGLHDSGFVLTGIVARASGHFALLGHVRDVSRERAEVFVQARGGDASGLEEADTVLHRCTSCIATSLMNVLADGSVLIEAGAIAPGRKLVLVAEQSRLP